MTLVTEALDRIARQCSVKAPSSWLTATRDDHLELRDDFLLETVDDILDRCDMPSPIGAQTTIAGDGSETYSLPVNFKRLARDELAVYDNNLDQPVYPITTDGEWTHLKDIGTVGAVKFYRLTGYEDNWSISIYDEPTDSITVSYISRNWMASGSGTAGYAFTAAEDVLLLPRRIVETGVVWRFRERRGLPYADKRAEYETLIHRHDIGSRGRRNIAIGGNRNEVRWQDLIPAFIPSS